MACRFVQKKKPVMWSYLKPLYEELSRLEQGVEMHDIDNHHTHIFPFKTEKPKGPERSVESLQTDFNKAIINIQENKKTHVIRGVKGPFWFMFIEL